MSPADEPVAKDKPEESNCNAVISATGSSGKGTVGAGSSATRLRERESQNSTVPSEVPNASRLWLSSAIAAVLTLPVFIPPCSAPPPAEVRSSPPTSIS